MSAQRSIHTSRTNKEGDAEANAPRPGRARGAKSRKKPSLRAAGLAARELGAWRRWPAVQGHWALHNTFTCEGSDFSGLTTFLLWQHLRILASGVVVFVGIAVRGASRRLRGPQSRHGRSHLNHTNAHFTQRRRVHAKPVKGGFLYCMRDACSRPAAKGRCAVISHEITRPLITHVSRIL